MLRDPLVMKMCSNQLWEGVCCDLPAGHKGPHHRSATDAGAALSWRSSATSQAPTPSGRPAMFSLATLATLGR